MTQKVIYLSEADCSSEVTDDSILIVPGVDCLLTTVNLPKLPKHRLLQALPFALEDKLIADIHQLHFAIPSIFNDFVPVAIVAKDKMNEWLYKFKSHQPKVYLPETLAIPYDDERWHIVIHHQQCIVRTGKFSGFVCETNQLEFYLTLALKKLTPPKIGVNIYNFTQQRQVLTLNILINEVQLPETGLLQFFEENINKHPPVMNLLQGAYRPKETTAVNKKIWTLTFVFAGISLLLLFSSQIISWVILKHGINQMESAIAKIYQQQFPNATSVVAPRERLIAKLKKLSSDDDHYLFLQLLGEVSATLSHMQDIHLQQFDFHDKNLTILVRATSFERLDLFIQKLRSSHLVVKQLNADLVGRDIKADLSLHKDVA